jgi:hypothetical protein
MEVRFSASLHTMVNNTVRKCKLDIQKKIMLMDLVNAQCQTTWYTARNPKVRASNYILLLHTHWFKIT